MRSLEQMVLYTTHRWERLAAEILAGPVIDMSVQSCAPLGPFVHDKEELPALTPKQVSCRCHPAGQLVGGARRPGGGGLQWWRTTWTPPLLKSCGGIWQAATRVLSTSPSSKLGRVRASCRQSQPLEEILVPLPTRICRQYHGLPCM